MERFDVFVIGGGGTGSEVAFSLAGSGAGLRVGIAERDKLGGECNNYGCVPTKAMLASAKVAASARGADRYGVRVPSVEVDFPAVMRRVREIIDSQSGEGAKPFEEQGIRVFLQEARLLGERRVELADGTEIEADRIVLATGTEAAIPPIDGLRDGPYWTNKEAIWSPKEVPASLAVIGSGPIGLEFAQIYARFGAEVTVVELSDRTLPGEDRDSSTAICEALEDEGIRLLVDTTSCRATHGADGWQIDFEDDEHVHAEQVLVAIGRRPVFEAHDLDAAGVKVNDKGFPVLDDTLRTTAENIWAAGDATGELLFTHVGSYEAEIVADDILDRPRKRDYRVVPRVTFTEPEVGSVGLTEEQAGEDAVTSLVRFSDNERAHLEGKTFGIVKLVADRRNGELVGGHVVGEGAGEMIHEVAAAMAGRVPPRVLAETIHAYPTLSESLKSAFSDLAELLDA
jgi:pyruvate/2-oxoglutarate dehydrogenase complex dihydrolipoamide dehydrogenase (E3) component